MNILKSHISVGHHTVSACYLRNFLGDKEKKLWVAQRSPLKYYQKIPEEISVVNHFNTIQFPTLKPDAMEENYSQLEDKFTPAAQRAIENGKFYDEQDRNNILAFISMLYVRNPRSRAHIPRFWEEQIKRLIANNPQIPNDGMKEFFLSDNVRIKSHTNIAIMTEGKMLVPTWLILMKRKWTFFKAPKGSEGFITSDHPVYLSWRNHQNKSNRLPALADLNTILFFPLSNKIALIGTFEGQETAVDITEEEVWGVNSMMILNAKNQIYAKNKEFLYYTQGDKNPRKGFDLLKNEEFKEPSPLDM